MTSRSSRVAVYTTVYPGVEPFLPAWHRSVASQTDGDFDLWIGLDQLEPSDVVRAVGGTPRAEWLPSVPGARPGQLRAEALAQLAATYEWLVLVDSDDVLAPERVASARAALERCDVAACGLRFIDADGRDLGKVFGPERPTEAVDLLPRYNVFGLSNTAYRGETLAACLPVPRDCLLLDWLLATRAWAQGAKLRFEPEPHMGYRQHARNTARVLPPFTEEDVKRATDLVLRHYTLTLDDSWPIPQPMRGAVERARTSVAEFGHAVGASPERLTRYVAALNREPPRHVWWWLVALPALEDVWKN